jgi:hypothetical protein
MSMAGEERRLEQLEALNGRRRILIRSSRAWRRNGARLRVAVVLGREVREATVLGLAAVAALGTHDDEWRRGIQRLGWAAAEQGRRREGALGGGRGGSRGANFLELTARGLAYPAHELLHP